MARFIFKRVLWMIPVLLGVLFIIFTINHFTPGDPVLAILGSDCTEEQYEAKQQELGLDQPFLVQYVKYVWGVLTRFDLGTSYSTKRAVSTEILERLPNTLKIGIWGVLSSIFLAIPLGVLSATHQGGIYDYCVRIGTIILAALPSFWIALMSIILFSLKLKWFPASFSGDWTSWVLPIFSLAIGPIASVARMTRSSMLEVIRQDYIRTARAKGLSQRDVNRKHVLKNGLIPVVTVVGGQLSMIMGGSILVETIFSIPGLGTLMNNAIATNNYPVIQGGVLVISITVCIMNLLIDLAYAFIDPRIMAQYKSVSRKKAKRSPQRPAAEEAA